MRLEGRASYETAMKQLALFETDRQSELESEPPGTPREQWYTPQNIVERAIAVMGSIDLDPCSGSANVPAALRFTAADNGLAQTWGPKRRVFLNPPFSRATSAWVAKLCGEYEAGNIVEAIALVRAAVDTDWWLRLMSYPVCFVHGRLRFSGEMGSTTSPSAVVYLGPHLTRFADAFSDIGAVYVPYSRGLTARDLQVGQYGRYVMTVHPVACEITIANPGWDEASGASDQERLRRAILTIPGIMPSQYNNVSKSREGTTRLIFHYDKNQADEVIDVVESLLVGPAKRQLRHSVRRKR
jgi:phage N-6-adenine-methyltransferase